MQNNEIVISRGMVAEVIFSATLERELARSGPLTIPMRPTRLPEMAGRNQSDRAAYYAVEAERPFF